MFFSLLLVTFIISVFTCFLVVRFFNKPIETILSRIIADDISYAWLRYITFALYVVGISGGVRIYQLERYITPVIDKEQMITLTPERWTLEIYRTIISSLQSMAWMLLIFFIFALIAYVLIRILGPKKNRETQAQ